MTRILHISDTHFGTEVPAVVEAIVKQAVALKPDIVILSGDVTQRARRAEFAAAKEFFTRIGAPVHLAVPGNHDLPLYDVFTRSLNPYRFYRKFFGPRQQVWHDGRMAIACLDATHPLRHTRGKTKLKSARDLLESARRAIGPNGLLGVAEHQPLDVKIPNDMPEILMNAAQTAQLFAEYRVDIVFSGHVHFPLIRDTRELFRLPRHFIISGAGTAVSRRTRSNAPNSFNVVDIRDGGVAIALHAYQPQGDFEVAHQAVFSRDEGGWRGA